jgi:hypothetical protein
MGVAATAEIDDVHTIAPPPAPSIRGQDRLRHQEHRTHVHRHQHFPFFQRRLEERLDDDRSGMIEKRGDRAIARDNIGNRPVDRGFLGNVDFEENRVAAGRLDCRHRFFSSHGIAVDDGYLGALRGEKPGRRAAHSGRAARNQRHLALHSSGHSFTPGRCAIAATEIICDPVSPGCRFAPCSGLTKASSSEHAATAKPA